MPNTQQETLGQRIKQSRQKLNYRLEDVAESLQVTASAVSAWENDLHRPRQKQLPLLADVLQVSYSWLITGEQFAERTVASGGMSGVAAIPLFEWANLPRLEILLQRKPSEFAGERITTTVNVGPRAFALTVIGDSMGDEIPESYLIVVDPDVQPKHKSYVLVQLAKDMPYTLRKMVTDSGRPLLKSANAPPEITGETTSIVGVIRECRKEFD